MKNYLAEQKITSDTLHSYGFDSYPGGFDCTNPNVWEEVPTYFTSAHTSVDPWGLMWLTEFQGNEAIRRSSCRSCAHNTYV
jgi:hypothetical protein